MNQSNGRCSELSEREREEFSTLFWQIEAADQSLTWWTKQDYLQELLNPDAHLFRLNENSLSHENVAAFLLYRELADEVWIMQLAVRAKRQGWGTRLLKAFLSSRAWTRVVLEVGESNLAARALYSRVGFRQVGFRKAYYRNGDSALVLEWTSKDEAT